MNRIPKGNDVIPALVKSCQCGRFLSPTTKWVE
jgi:hypothetical protein